MKNRKNKISDTSFVKGIYFLAIIAVVIFIIRLWQEVWFRWIMGLTIGSLTMYYFKKMTNKNQEPVNLQIKNNSQFNISISKTALPAPRDNNSRLDLSNPFLVNFINTQTASKLTDLDEKTKEIIRDGVRKSFSNRITPNKIAKEILDQIKLSSKENEELIQLQLELEKQGITKTKIVAKIESQRKSLLKEKALMIAATEVRIAHDSCQLAIWKYELSNDFFDEKTTFQVWQTDRSPCPMCKKMEGKKIKINDKWVLPNGQRVDVPSESHLGCLCTMTLDFK